MCSANVTIFTAAAVVLATTSAWAGPTRLRVGLDYRRDPGAEACPDASTFHRHTIAIFGRDPIADIVDPRLVVELRRHGSDVVAVATVEERGAVTWRAESSAPVAECSDLVDGVALALKTALEREPPPAAPSSAATIAPAPVDARGLRSPSARAPGRAWHFGVGVDAAAYWWSFPLPALAFGASAELRWRALSIGMEGAYSPPSTFGFYTIQAFLSGVSVCGHYSLVYGCGVFMIGHAMLDARNKSYTGTFSTIGPRLGLELPIARWLRLRLHADLASRVSPYLGSVNLMPVKAPPPWSVGAGVGVVAVF